MRRGAALRKLEGQASELGAELEARRAQQASGVGGEEAMTAAVEVLAANGWCFVAMPAAAGRVDHLLIGPGGVWATEVKVRAVQIHVDGDHWWFEKFDRDADQVDQGVLTDRRGRSRGRQVADVAGELEAFLAFGGQHVGVRSAVVVLHKGAQLGSCRSLGIDLLCIGTGYLLDSRGAARGPAVPGGPRSRGRPGTTRPRLPRLAAQAPPRKLTRPAYRPFRGTRERVRGGDGRDRAAAGSLASEATAMSHAAPGAAGPQLYARRAH